MKELLAEIMGHLEKAEQGLSINDLQNRMQHLDRRDITNFIAILKFEGKIKPSSVKDGNVLWKVKAPVSA
jgi:hypothetical protein